MNRLDVAAGAGAAILGIIEVFRLFSAVEAPAMAASVRPASSAAVASASATASPSASATSRCPAVDPWMPSVETRGDDPAPVAIEDAANAMAPFYEKVAAMLRGTARGPIRVAWYGDSNAMHDYLTGAIRRRVQAKFGDAGHGYLGLIRPWGWYQPLDVRRGDDGLWEPYNVTTHTMFDERYGHAFISPHSMGSSRTWVATAEQGAIGTTVSRFEVAYLKGPYYGKFEAKVDGVKVADIDSRDPNFSAGIWKHEVPDGPHKLELQVKGERGVRLLGAVMERDVPSMVIDNLAVGSMNCICMLRGDEAIHEETLQWRAYDLVVVHLGTNLFDANKVLPCMTKVIERFHKALPGVPVMIVTPPDFVGSKTPPRTAGWMKDTLRELRRTARENGAPLYDFYEAMGGDGAMGRYVHLGMTIPGDWVHFNEAGGAYMGDRVLYAIFQGARDYVAKTAAAGCPK